MHRQPLTATEQRVLGCLIEKRLTTPDQYPLSLNALRLACNQSTNRSPVLQLSEPEVRDAAQNLCRYGLARLASGHTSRAIKYRHLAEEALGLRAEELPVLAVLMLRGEQTPGELKARSDRMAPLSTLADVERILATLIDRAYARRLGRRPGQKEDRFVPTLAEDPAEGASPPVAAVPVSPAPSPPAPAPAAPIGDAGSALEHRVSALERELVELRAELADLRSGAPAPPGT